MGAGAFYIGPHQGFTRQAAAVQVTQHVGNGQRLDIDEVRIGDLMIIRPGERIPTDGTVVEGLSTVNEAMVTGESLPVAKGPGDPVTGASLNKTGAFRYRATRVGAGLARRVW